MLGITEQVQTLRRTFVPAAVKARVRLISERSALSKVPKNERPAADLRFIPLGELCSMLFSPDNERRWEDCQREMAPLEVPLSSGGISPADQKLLFHLVSGLRPKSILEVGTHIGCSTATLACAAKWLQEEDGQKRSIITVDIRDTNDPLKQPWKKAGAKHSPAVMAAMLGCWEMVTFRVQPSLEFLHSSEGGQFDFIFLDGDHAAAVVYRELPAAIARLAPGGVVLLHDYVPDLRPLVPGKKVIPGVFLAVKRLLDEGAQLSVLPLGQLSRLAGSESAASSLALISAAFPAL